MSDVLIGLVFYLGSNILPFTFPIGWILLYITYFVMIHILRKKNNNRLDYLTYKTHNENVIGRMNDIVSYGYLLGALTPRVLKYYWNSEDANLLEIRILKTIGKLAFLLMIGVFSLVVILGLITFIVIEFE